MTEPDPAAGLDSSPASFGAALKAAVRTVESLVSMGSPSASVYQAVVDGALTLLGGDSGSLRFVDAEDPNWMVAVAWRGAAGRDERWRHRAPITEGVSGRVISTGQPVAVVRHLEASNPSQLAPSGTQAIVGAPIRELGRVIGSLVVGSKIPEHRWTLRDRNLLSAYAEQVEVAVVVASVRQAVQQAFTDPLTGLGNRRRLIDRLQHELVRADRNLGSVTVLFMDLDGFKRVNDSLGHFVGDQLLVAVAERLQACVRDADTCFRVGGDEFAVLLGESSEPLTAADRIISALRTRFQIAEHEVPVSVSVGIASGRAEAETLLSNADVAMYEAKRAGSGRYRRYEPGMQAARQARLGLATEFRLALTRQEFDLYYQPLWDLRSGRIAAFEGLVRWCHASRGVLAAGDFIPLAEESGLVVELGHWVLAEGCSQLASWRHDAPLTLCLNASLIELAQPDYAAIVEDAIRARFPPSALVIEVTEHAPLEETPGVMCSLNAINKLGVRVAVDDFGGGHASFLNLAHAPVDVLKIAKQLVDAIDAGNTRAARLLAASISVGQQLELLTVVQGIERPDQRELVAQLTCDFAQGYLLGPPVDSTAATELLRRQRAGELTRWP